MLARDKISGGSKVRLDRGRPEGKGCQTGTAIFAPVCLFFLSFPELGTELSFPKARTLSPKKLREDVSERQTGIRAQSYSHRI